MSFPKDFLFGAASAAYQVEGAPAEDGKRPSIWDTFAHTAGKIQHGETGDMACDHYHLFGRDVDVMREMGLQAYRFSISWPRVMPDGQDDVNEAGLAFYDRLIDRLLEAGIEPFVTLYHWDLPQKLQDMGGWNNPETARRFCRFAQVVAKRFKGRVKNYMTFNEPQIFIGLGLHRGVHAPGYRLPQGVCVQAAHNVIMAHFAALKAIRQEDPDALVGIASTGFLPIPVHDTPANVSKAIECMEKATQADLWFDHALFCDPMIKGRYPDALLASGTVTREQQQEVAAAFAPMDFLGLNIYNGQYVDENGEAVKKYPGYPRSSLKWPLTPEVLYWGPKLMHQIYSLPVYVTENGISQQDVICCDGQVHDPNRSDFLRRYLECLHAAVQEEVPVKGYFYWALTDNFEWHSGYDERFGLVYVDYRTQERLIKDSGRWYQRLIASRTFENEANSAGSCGCSVPLK